MDNEQMEQSRYGSNRRRYVYEYEVQVVQQDMGSLENIYHWITPSKFIRRRKRIGNAHALTRRTISSL